KNNGRCLKKKFYIDEDNWDKFKHDLCKVPFYRNRESVEKSGVDWNLLCKVDGVVLLPRHAEESNDAMQNRITNSSENKNKASQTAIPTQLVSDMLVSEQSLRVRAIHDERLFLMACILHLADISNPARPIAIASLWAQRIREEFFAQVLHAYIHIHIYIYVYGDEEKSLGITVKPTMDRFSGITIAQASIGFIEYVLLEFFELMVGQLLRDRQIALDHLKKNLIYWKGQAKKDTRGHGKLEGKIVCDIVCQTMSQTNLSLFYFILFFFQVCQVSKMCYKSKCFVLKYSQQLIGKIYRFFFLCLRRVIYATCVLCAGSCLIMFLLFALQFIVWF
ncbi:hypothetical protein RFI_20540, partial [Reticulomyxa filosa]